MKLNGGQIIAEVMREQKAKYVFGIPGGQTLWVVDALRETEIEFIPTRHEGGAGHAADAYGRVTGQPGYCLATTGPGATNLLTPMGGALRDSSPMILLVFQNRNADYMRGNAQEADHRSIFSSLCKAYIPIHTADSAAWAMREAYRIAMSGKKGPVVVDIFRDAIEEQEAEYVPLKLEEYFAEGVVYPEKEKITQAAKAIAENVKVVIYCGGGVVSSGIGDEVLELSELLDAPVVTSFNGMSAVTTEHPNVFGPRSRHGSRVTRQIIEEADCVLALGTSFSAVATNKFALKFKNIIQIDSRREAIGRNYPVMQGIVGSLEPSVKLLIDAVKKERTDKAAAKKAWLEQLKAERENWLKEVFSGERADAAAVPAAPVAVMAELSKVLSENCVFCCDAGNPGAWAHLLPMKKGMRFMKPVNYGNMGTAIPSAIASKLRYPEREVFAMLGDGSLGMELGDLETASRLGVKIIIIALNDGAYGNIKQEELYKFGEGRYYGVDLSQIRYSETAKTLGCNAVYVEKAEDLAAAVENARAYDGPTLIEVRFDGSYTVWPEAF